TARIALLERAQRLEREIVNVSESEQRRIGQDLHDGICQHLAALSCAATSLRDDLRKLGLRSEAVTAEDSLLSCAPRSCKPAIYPMVWRRRTLARWGSPWPWSHRPVSFPLAGY